MTSKSKTGIVFDDRMKEHENIWEPHHWETPLRYSKSLERCKEYGLLERCTILPSKFASEEELLLVHDKNHIKEMQKTKTIKNEQELEEFATKYDCLYLNNKTFDAALVSAGCGLQLVSSVINGEVDNGMAVIRPPGHHAMRTEACGYCIFNNIAIAANYALKNLNLSRILIVDWDVHHGQATQRIFYDDPRVLYFSIHRYENGAFWPYLRESNFDHVGGNTAKGRNINVPLNGIGQGDAEYLAIFNNVLLPIAYEFAPELVLISAGYDAAIGCPEGEMKVSPTAYSHFITLLSCLANGKICVFLEGGYCLSSLSESVALTVKALLGDPCPSLKPCFYINQVTVDSILNVLSVQRNYWNSIAFQPIYKSDYEYKGEKHFVHIDYTGSPFEGATKFATRGYSQEQISHLKLFLDLEIENIVSKIDSRIPLHKTCFLLNSESKICALRNIDENEILSQCTWLDMEEGNLNLLGIKNVKTLKSASLISDDFLQKQVGQHISHETSLGLLKLAAVVANRICNNGLILRSSISDSSQTEREEISNELEFAIAYLQQQQSLKRIVIINLNDNHNESIQERYYEDDKVLVISLHYCDEKVCPISVEKVGLSSGKGYNINIPFLNNSTDGDLLAASFQIILPILYEFCPEFVFITSSLKGEVISLPFGFGVMVGLLSAQANGKIVIHIEGWNQEKSSNEAKRCISALLGNSRKTLQLPSLKPSHQAVVSIQNVVRIQKLFWRVLVFDKALPMIVKD